MPATDWCHILSRNSRTPATHQPVRDSPTSSQLPSPRGRLTPGIRDRERLSHAYPQSPGSKLIDPRQEETAYSPPQHGARVTSTLTTPPRDHVRYPTSQAAAFETHSTTATGKARKEQQCAPQLVDRGRGNTNGVVMPQTHRDHDGFHRILALLSTWQSRIHLFAREPEPSGQPHRLPGGYKGSGHGHCSERARARALSTPPHCGQRTALVPLGGGNPAQPSKPASGSTRTDLGEDHRRRLRVTNAVHDKLQVTSRRPTPSAVHEVAGWAQIYLLSAVAPVWAVG